MKKVDKISTFLFFMYIYNKRIRIMALKNEIIKYDLEGNEVCRYNSAREAGIIEGISEDKIYKVLSGKQKTADGWVFKKSGISPNAVNKIGTGNYKCPYCERRFKTYNGLCKHVIRQKQHGEITSEKLLTDFKYNGVRPTCKCGCGEYTSIDPNKEAHFCDYVSGHAIRVHNNWGHNPKAIEHSANTRREQYKNGEREPWNKGKKWEETFTPEEIETMRNKIYTEERAAKLHYSLIGVPKSPEHAEKCRYNGGCERTKQILSAKLRQRLNDGKFSLSSASEDG